ncbi:hypothetical protein MRY87_04805 [bacterium]|nr:hypothetical protein [bacterium]
MALEYSVSGAQWRVSRSIGKVVQGFTVVFAGMVLIVAAQVPLSRGEDLLGLLFLLSMGTPPVLLSFLGRKTLVIDRSQRSAEIFYGLAGIQQKWFFKTFRIPLAATVSVERATRRTSKGSYSVYVVVIQDQPTQARAELFDFGSGRQASDLARRISQFLDIEDSTTPEIRATMRSHTTTNSLAGPIAVAAVFLFLLFTGFPFHTSEKPTPPPGVKTYRDGDLTCWDKTVCCDENDRSTCETIPTCIQD